MKKSHLKIIMLLLTMIVVLFFCSFVLNIKFDNILTILFWIIIFIVLKFSLGFEKDKSLIKNDIMMEIFIFVFIYLIFQYLFGIFLGFVRSPYSLDILNIIKNILPVIILIIFEELSRYIIITKGKGNKYIPLLSVVLFVLYEIVIGIDLYDVASSMGLFNFITLIILTSISKNILLTFITKEAGYKPSMLYRFILELFIYVVPIYTSLGDYLSAIFNIIFPLLLYLRLSTVFKNKNKFFLKGNRIASKTCSILLILLLSVLIILTSNCFKYYMLVIASNSMKPYISIGDAVIIEKIENNELDIINIDDILVYEHDNKIIVHRVTNIFNVDENYIFQTKGDNNIDYDSWLVYEDDVIGIVKSRIIGIGYPTVLLNEFMNN